MGYVFARGELRAVAEDYRPLAEAQRPVGRKTRRAKSMVALIDIFAPVLSRVV
jgi:hypothetical protein